MIKDSWFIFHCCPATAQNGGVYADLYEDEVEKVPGCDHEDHPRTLCDAELSH